MATGPLWQVVRHIRRLVGAPSGSAATDAQLLARFAHDRDETAFAALVEQHGPLVWSVCRRVLQQDQDAEDVFQATFLVLARKAATIRKQDSVGSWLYGAAYRLALKLRVAAAKRHRHETSAPDDAPPAADTDPDDMPTEPRAEAAVLPTTCDLERHELRGILDEELNRLPEKYRAPLVLCYLQGKTNEEAAQELHWTKGTVSGRLARARDLLRDRLARRGWAFAAPALATVFTEQMATADPPAALAQTTIASASLFAATRTAAAGLVSDRVASLAEGVVHTMWMTKLKLTCALALTLTVVASGAGYMAFRPEAQAVPVPDPITETKNEEPARTHPPGVPLEAKIIVKKDTYTLDLGGKTAAEFEQETKKQRDQPRPPTVDLLFEVRNTSDREMTLTFIPAAKPMLDLKGPGALQEQYRGPHPDVILKPVATKLAAGQKLSFTVSSLWSSWFGELSYWTKPGEYTLTASYGFQVSPAPKGSTLADDGSGYVAVFHAVKLHVIDKKDAKLEAAKPWLIVARTEGPLDLPAECAIRNPADLGVSNGQKGDPGREVSAQLAKDLGVDSIDWQKQMVVFIRGLDRPTPVDTVKFLGLTRKDQTLTPRWEMTLSTRGAPDKVVRTPSLILLVDRIDGPITIGPREVEQRIKDVK